MNLKRKKKAELIEYIQELETRNQYTESKLAEANYIIENSETLDKDVVRLAQTAFDEKRQALEIYAKLEALLAEVKANIAEREAIKNQCLALLAEVKANIAENEAQYYRNLDLYIKSRPELAVHYLEEAYSLPSSDPNSRGTSDLNTI